MRIYWDCFERPIGAIIIIVVLSLANSMRGGAWQLSTGLEIAYLAFIDRISDRRLGNRKQKLEANLLFGAETKVTELLT